MTEKNSITKRQHYVPQFYLKRFVNPDGKLNILDCERRKVVASRAPRSVCKEDYFYALNGELDEVSQSLEEGLQKIETDIANGYDDVAKRVSDFKEITHDDKMLVATFMSLQYLRGLYMRKQTKRMDEDFIKKITRLRYGSGNIHTSLDRLENETGEKLSEKEREELIEFAKSGDYRVETNNASHLQLLSQIEGFRNLFYGKRWTVYVSKSSKKFVTSDNPVAEMFPEWTGRFFYGPSFFQRTHYFAMTPDILIVAGDVLRGEKRVKRKTLFDSREGNAKILTLNFTVSRHAIAYAYANDKTLLQDIVDGVNLYDRQQSKKA